MPDYHRQINYALIILFYIFLLPFSAVSDPQKPKVYTVNYPLMYFAERIGSGLIEVHFPAPRNIDPAYWVPSTQNIREYQEADLIIINGLDYAKWLKYYSLPESKIVNTSKKFKKSYIETRDTTSHSHGPGGEHVHANLAFTTWIDPILAIKQAEEINFALSRLMPEHKDLFQKNFENLKSDLLEIDSGLSEVLNTYAGKPLLTSHPVYQYLGARYKLKLTNLHLEPDTVPDKAEQDKIKKMLNETDFIFILWEDNPVETSGEFFQQQGVLNVTFRNAANRPEAGDYLGVMKSNITNLNSVKNR